MFTSDCNCEKHGFRTRGGTNYMAISHIWTEGDWFRSYLQRDMEKLGADGYWLDWDCINQDCQLDVQAQIGQMAQIYKQATAVVIYAGHESEQVDAKELNVYLRELCENCLPWVDGEMEGTEMDYDELIGQHLQSNAYARALMSLLMSNWPTRVWTMQEALMCDNTWFSCGGCLVSINLISDVAYSLSKVWAMSAWRSRQVEAFTAFQVHIDLFPEERNFSAVASRLSGCECYTDIDRLYAIGGLCDITYPEKACSSEDLYKHVVAALSNKGDYTWMVIVTKNYLDLVPLNPAERYLSGRLNNLSLATPAASQSGQVVETRQIIIHTRTLYIFSSFVAALVNAVGIKHAAKLLEIDAGQICGWVDGINDGVKPSDSNYSNINRITCDWSPGGPIVHQALEFKNIGVLNHVEMSIMSLFSRQWSDLLKDLARAAIGSLAIVCSHEGNIMLGIAKSENLVDIPLQLNKKPLVIAAGYICVQVGLLSRKHISMPSGWAIPQLFPLSLSHKVFSDVYSKNQVYTREEQSHALFGVIRGIADQELYESCQQLQLDPTYPIPLNSWLLQKILKEVHLWHTNLPRRLYDTKGRKIVSTKELYIKSFAIVSYVWGSIEHNKTLPDVIGCNWDIHSISAEGLAAVEELTQACGLQYVWVDVLCISQNNAAEKQEEISRMHLYYASATVCLVFTNGLYADIGEFQLAQWAGRLWTLQEAYLALQMLFFTSYGVFTKSQIAHQLQISGTVVGCGDILPTSLFGRQLSVLCDWWGPTPLAIKEQLQIRETTNKAEKFMAVLGLINFLTGGTLQLDSMDVELDEKLVIKSLSSSDAHEWLLTGLVTGSKTEQIEFSKGAYQTLRLEVGAVMTGQNSFPRLDTWTVDHEGKE
ncbi:hypothetical protein HK100_003889, partial [Physocladia obscura]